MRVARAALRVGVAIGLGSLAAATAFAQQPQLTGNAQRGQILSYTCLGCHGIAGYRNAYPDYAVPRLRGQNAQYIIAALNDYKSGLRDHPTMRLQASSLSEQDIADIAAYFSGKPLVATAAPAAKRPVPKAAQLCVSCHGTEGIAVAPMYPDLAGQHPSYLTRAIQEYHNKERRNPIMDSMAASLTKQEVSAIVDYFSSLPGLHTEPRPFFRWTDRQQPAQR